MTEIFVTLFNMSLSASWIVLAVVLLRFVLKKAPKWIHCLLWSVVALRLVIPFLPESALSLIPSAEVIPQDIVVSQVPAIDSGIPAVNNAVNPVLTQTPGISLQTVLFTAAVLWLAGMAGMALYSAVSYLRLRRQVSASLACAERVYLCDNIDTPFILGVCRPKIYIPSGLSGERREYVVAHEKAHLRRKDHWWKPLGFCLLTVYWLNPLIWVAYILLCRDIEKACDEKVIRDMDNEAKRGYSETLAACSFQRRLVMACPLAFGEVAVKDRIKAVLNYKKPVFWVVAAAVAVCVVAAVCFLSNPKPCEHVYQSKITLNATCTQEGIETFTCTDCWDSYTKPVPSLSHAYTEGVEVQPATCAEEGEMFYTCTVCRMVKNEKTEKLPHTFGESTVTKEPNCTEKGEKSATCTLCAETCVVELLETNDVHDIQNTVIRAATCTDPGEGINTCTRCDHTENCTYETLGHDYVEGLTLVATCRSEGQKEYVCSICGTKKYETLPKTDDHRWISMGYWSDQCIICGKTRDDDDEESSSGYSLLDGVTNTSKSDGTLPTIPVIQIWP